MFVKPVFGGQKLLTKQICREDNDYSGLFVLLIHISRIGGRNGINSFGNKAKEIGRETTRRFDKAYRGDDTSQIGNCREFRYGGNKIVASRSQFSF